jgi:type I restriction enzyme S subunit
MSMRVSLLSQVPLNWRTTRLKFVTEKIGSGKTPSGGAESYVSEGVPFLRSQNVRFDGLSLSDVVYIDHSTDESMSSSRIQPQDVLLNITGASIGRCCVVPADLRFGNVNQHVCIIRPRQRLIQSRYLNAVLASDVGQQQVFEGEQGISRQGLNFDELGDFLLPLPSLEIQHRIADYLDRETARIDALIVAKERLLTALAEKRRALISHAVTRGLNPAAPRRESGLPWLGMIPKHWHVHRLKFNMPRIEQGWSPQCDNFPATEDEWGVLKVGAVNGWEFDPQENKRLPLEVQPLTECEIHEGDILMSRANTTQLLGLAALVRTVRPKLIFCDKHYRLALNQKTLNAEFLVLYLRSTAGHYEFERDATGASNSMQNIGQDSVKNAWITVPPIPEQLEIVRYITIAAEQIDTMEAASRRTVELLRERRSALIAAAVTGQLAVER